MFQGTLRTSCCPEEVAAFKNETERALVQGSVPEACSQNTPAIAAVPNLFGTRD